jgi:TonB family protein
MDQATVELLRLLQGDVHDDAALRQITALYRAQRSALMSVDDQGMISQLGELLEGWAEGATGEVASAALCEAAVSAEEDLEQPERAIRILERVLDLEPTPEALEQLARLYTKRGAPGDVAQAAELYAALGDTLAEAGKPWLERALDLAPTHEAALVSLEALIPEEDHATALRERWTVYLEHGGDARPSDPGGEAAAAAASGQSVNAGERRRLTLSRAYAAEGSYRDALMCIAPLAERGHTEAARLQEAYLANLEGAVAPAKRGRKAESLPPPKHVRSARSGGTMVGFRLDQYHEALKREGEPLEDESESASDQERSESQPSAALEAAPAIADKPEEDSVVRPMPKATPGKTVLGLGARPDLPNAPAVEQAASPEAPVEAPVRKSLPPPNPAVVRKSSAPRAARTSKGGGQALAAAPLNKTMPRRQLHVAAAPAPIAHAFAAPSPAGLPAPVFAPVAQSALPMPSAVADTHEIGAFSAPIAQSFGEPPDLVAASMRHEEQRKNKLWVWPIAIGVTAIIAGGAWMMASSKPSKTDLSAATAPSASTTTAPTAAAAPAPVAAAPAPVAPAPVAPAPVVAPEPVAKAAPVKENEQGTIKPLTKEMRVKGGRITGAQMLIALEDALPKIEHCYAEALEDKPKLEGKATLGFAIGKTGKVATPKIAKSTLKHAKLEKCAVDAIRNERFPKMKKVAKVTLPISFSP